MDKNGTTFGIEKVYSTGEKHFETITFKKRCEAYRYIMDDFISETLNKAWDEMSAEDFTWLCIQAIMIVGRYIERE